MLNDQLLAFIAERFDRRCDAEKLRVLSNLKTCVFPSSANHLLTDITQEPCILSLFFQSLAIQRPLVLPAAPSQCSYALSLGRVVPKRPTSHEHRHHDVVGTHLSSTFALGDDPEPLAVHSHRHHVVMCPCLSCWDEPSSAAAFAK